MDYEFLRTYRRSFSGSRIFELLISFEGLGNIITIQPFRALHVYSLNSGVDSLRTSNDVAISVLAIPMVHLT